MCISNSLQVYNYNKKLKKSKIRFLLQFFYLIEIAGCQSFHGLSATKNQNKYDDNIKMAV